ncbi:MAG: hypothetical protein ACJA2X_001433 [Halocynthiibacter sp.]|jgi:hypothetical protein
MANVSLLDLLYNALARHFCRDNRVEFSYRHRNLLPQYLPPGAQPQCREPYLRQSLF